jgi:DNA-binding NarL/FixJ family response regulator
MTRLMLVEGQAAIRFGLRMWLKLAPDVEIIGESGDGLTALTQASLLQPDVIVTEVEAIGMDGIELVKTLRRVSPDSAIVILSLRDDAVTREHAKSAGVAAFVSKHEYGERLLPAIRRAVHGRAEPPRAPERLNRVRDQLT